MLIGLVRVSHVESLLENPQNSVFYMMDGEACRGIIKKSWFVRAWACLKCADMGSTSVDSQKFTKIKTNGEVVNKAKLKFCIVLLFEWLWVVGPNRAKVG